MLIIEKFIKDSSKWVRNCLFQEFGKVIYQLSLYAKSDISKKIDKLIITYVEERKKEDLEDSDLINYYIAYNMPCLILVSSTKLWKFLRDHYIEL
jgi:hypothetical protein